MLDRDLALGLGGEQLDLVGAERRVAVLHLAEPHQELDQVGDGRAESLREVAQRHARFDGDRPGGGRDLARLLGLANLVAVAGPLALPGAGTAGAALDHDTALPVSRAASSSGSDGSTAWHMSSSVEPCEIGVDDDRSEERRVGKAWRWRWVQACE